MLGILLLPPGRTISAHNTGVLYYFPTNMPCTGLLKLQHPRVGQMGAFTSSHTSTLFKYNFLPLMKNWLYRYWLYIELIIRTIIIYLTSKLFQSINKGFWCLWPRHRRTAGTSQLPARATFQTLWSAAQCNRYASSGWINRVWSSYCTYIIINHHHHHQFYFHVVRISSSIIINHHQFYFHQF